MADMKKEPSSEFYHWVSEQALQLGWKVLRVEKASEDAGAREYWRVVTADSTYIGMDASKETAESFLAFLKVDQLMVQAGIEVPKVLRHDSDKQYMLVNDLGTSTALNIVNEDNAFQLMDKATDILVKWQKASSPNVLPEYSRTLLERELSLFPEWYVKQYRQKTWSPEAQKWWQMTVDALLDNILQQNHVFVHRDYMLRNIMPFGDGLAVLDFQDAVYGPVSYDIISLLRDAFVSWNESFVLDVAIRYWEKARKAGVPVPQDFSVFYQDMEFMGVQRHLKVMGIFARLNYRDGKPKYLADTPRFVNYVRQASRRYIALSPLMHLMDDLEGSETKVGYTF